MIKIAVCDDEKNIRSYLTSLVREQDVECRITKYASAERYLSSETEYGQLFLDIGLKDPASAQIPIPVFITSFMAWLTSV